MVQAYQEVSSFAAFSILNKNSSYKLLLVLMMFKETINIYIDDTNKPAMTMILTV